MSWSRRLQVGQDLSLVGLWVTLAVVSSHKAVSIALIVVAAFKLAGTVLGLRRRESAEHVGGGLTSSTVVREHQEALT